MDDSFDCKWIQCLTKTEEEETWKYVTHHNSKVLVAGGAEQGERASGIGIVRQRSIFSRKFYEFCMVATCAVHCCVGLKLDLVGIGVLSPADEPMKISKRERRHMIPRLSFSLCSRILSTAAPDRYISDDDHFQH